MELSFKAFIEDLRAREGNVINFSDEELRDGLKGFFANRTMEILCHLDENGVGKVIDFDNIKVGGTSNDDE